MVLLIFFAEDMYISVDLYSEDGLMKIVDIPPTPPSEICVQNLSNDYLPTSFFSGESRSPNSLLSTPSPLSKPPTRYCALAAPDF